MDYEDVSILRREININGKSRAFTNDTPVNLNVLKDLAIQLVDIHSQHQNLLLNSGYFQLQVIDTFSGNTSKLKDYQELYNKYLKLNKEFELLNDKSEKAKSDLDYFQFQFNHFIHSGNN